MGLLLEAPKNVESIYDQKMFSVEVFNINNDIIAPLNKIAKEIQDFNAYK